MGRTFVQPFSNWAVVNYFWEYLTLSRKTKSWCELLWGLQVSCSLVHWSSGKICHFFTSISSFSRLTGLLTECFFSCTCCYMTPTPCSYFSWVDPTTRTWAAVFYWKYNASYPGWINFKFSYQAFQTKRFSLFAKNNPTQSMGIKGGFRKTCCKTTKLPWHKGRLQILLSGFCP